MRSGGGGCCEAVFVPRLDLGLGVLSAVPCEPVGRGGGGGKIRFERLRQAECMHTAKNISFSAQQNPLASGYK